MLNLLDLVPGAAVRICDFGDACDQIVPLKSP